MSGSSSLREEDTVSWSGIKGRQVYWGVGNETQSKSGWVGSGMAENSALSLVAEGRQVYRKQAIKRNPEHAESITGRQENNAG